jgi:hypothetical protein
MQIVRFTRHWGPYNAGETAGFDVAEAGRLIEAGVAVAAGVEVPAATAQPVSDPVQPPRRGRPRKG